MESRPQTWLSPRAGKCAKTAIIVDEVGAVNTCPHGPGIVSSIKHFPQSVELHSNTSLEDLLEFLNTTLDGRYYYC